MTFNSGADPFARFDIYGPSFFAFPEHLSKSQYKNSDHPADGVFQLSYGCLMEINKLLSELIVRFDFDFEDPEREWTVHNDWFTKQEDIQGSLRKRKTNSV